MHRRQPSNRRCRPIATTPAQPPAASETAFFISSMLRRVEFLTADGFSPYTGRMLEGGGMLTQVIGSSMGLIKDEAKGRFDYGISWVNDWAAHLNPLLLTRAFDVGFPWARPDCEGGGSLDQSSQFRCQRFFFSEPIYEVITSLFVRNELAHQVAEERGDCRRDAVPAGGPARVRARSDGPQLGQGRQGHPDASADGRRVLPPARRRHRRRRGRGRAGRARKHGVAQARPRRCGSSTSPWR